MQFQKPNSNIHLIVRGLLLYQNSVVLCRLKDSEWFFLPGGHIENGESAKKALLRELFEEIGETNFCSPSFVGICENIFPLGKNIFQHEVNIILALDILGNIKLKTKEKHLEFVFVNKNDLKNHNILPVALKEEIINWFDRKQPFLREIEADTYVTY